MLRQQIEEQQEPPAAQVRVTPQEIAQAVAGVEARRDAAILGSNTIAIGDAVSQLGLSATPDELLDELKTIRRRDAELQATTRDRRQTRKTRLLMAALGFSLLVNVVLIFDRPTPPPGPPTSAVVASGDTLTQNGTFQSFAGRTNEVRFVRPFSQPPNVELTIDPTFTKLVVEEVTTTGFHWRNTGPDDMFNNTTVEWKATGMR